MTTSPNPSLTATSKNLHQLVSGATDYAIGTAVQRNSFFVNEVPPQFQVETDEQVLSLVLHQLLNTIVCHTRNSCIRIKAQEYEDIIFISIRDNSSYSDYTTNDKLSEAKLLAKKMNGNIIVRNLEDRFTNVLLSFPNFPKTAC